MRTSDPKALLGKAFGRQSSNRSESPREIETSIRAWLKDAAPAAYGAGLRPWEIGRMTIGELIDTIRAHNDNLIAQAWWTASFSREKRLRPLKWYLRPSERKPISQVRREYREIKARLGRGLG